MKYTILGFQQAKLIELGLDTDDALILSVIRDMYSSKKMEHEIIDNDRFIWIDQSYLINQLPILGSKRKLVRKIKKYVELGLIERRVKNIKYNLKAKNEADKKKKGTFSYINTTEKLESLTEYETDDDMNEGYDKMSQRVRQNDLGGKTKCRNKDSSIKDSSIKDINIYSRVIEYLNKKANTSFRSTTKKTQQVIKARLDEGFKEDEFYTVIDKKVSEWLTDEKMSKFLRPETLFGTKFESYLNQKSNEKEDKKGNKSNTYKPFSFD